MMPHEKFRIAVFAGVLAVLAPSVSAQTMPTAPNLATVRVRFGPLLLNPTFSVTNAGVDDNVFNEAAQSAPKSDLTLTFTPATDWWLRFGPTWLTGSIKEDLVWYKDFASQRSANSNLSAGWVVPLNRLSFTVGGNWVNAKERPGFEIDARSQRHETAGNAAVEFRALSKTFLGASGERRNVEFDKDQIFLGTSLFFELNRTVTSGTATLRHQLTPLTNLTFAVGREEDRFEFSPLRDSDSTRLLFGVGFDPFALIKGSAQFGFRDFKPLSPDLPGYSGATAAVNLSYVLLGATRVSVNATRDIQYSYDVNQPYYLQTGLNGQVAQQLFGPVDVELRLGTARLAYTNREGAAVGLLDRVDHIRSWGTGVGYRLGRDLRVSFNVDDQKRRSEVDSREYDGLRYGFAVTYGL